MCQAFTWAAAFREVPDAAGGAQSHAAGLEVVNGAGEAAGGAVVGESAQAGVDLA